MDVVNLSPFGWGRGRNSEGKASKPQPPQYDRGRDRTNAPVTQGINFTSVTIAKKHVLEFLPIVNNC